MRIIEFDSGAVVDFLAQTINGSIARDCQKPVGKCSHVPIPCFWLVPDFEKGVLGDFFGMAGVIEHAHGDTVDSHPIATVKLRQSRLVVVAYGLQ